MTYISVISIVVALACCCDKCLGQARLGSTVAEFQQTFGAPSYEEQLQRSATIRWKGPVLVDRLLLGTKVQALEVATVDGIVFRVFLRCQRRLTRTDAALLAQRFVRRYDAKDFAAPAREYSGQSVYRLSSGETLILRRGRHRSFVGITSQTFNRDIEIHDSEAAKVRPPTSEN